MMHARHLFVKKQDLLDFSDTVLQILRGMLKKS